MAYRDLLSFRTSRLIRLYGIKAVLGLWLHPVIEFYGFEGQTDLRQFKLL